MMALALAVFLCFVGSLQSARVPGQNSFSNHETDRSLPPCDWSQQYLDSSASPPKCMQCSICEEDEHEISVCTRTADRVCSYCPKFQVWSENAAVCWDCGCCKGEPYSHQVQKVCLAAGLPVNQACMEDGLCPTPPIEHVKKDNANIIAIACGVVGFLVVAVVMSTLICKFSTKCKRKGIYRPASFSVEENRPGDRGAPAIGGQIDPNPNLEDPVAVQPFYQAQPQEQNDNTIQ